LKEVPKFNKTTPVWKSLRLDINKIWIVRRNDFENVRTKNLNLEANELREVEEEAFSNMKDFLGEIFLNRWIPWLGRL
jgi:hypothetical protein